MINGLPEKDRDVAIIGYYGEGNFGDDLLASYILNHTCKTISPERILVSAPKGSYLEKWFPGICSSSLRSIYRPSPNVIRKVVFGGGGFFFSFKSPGPLNLWGARTSTAWKNYYRLCPYHRANRLRFFACCVGIGPLSGKGARWITRRFLASFDQVSVRDHLSSTLLDLQNCRVTTDLSIGFANLKLPKTLQKEKSLGIVIRHWPFQNIDHLINNLQNAAQTLRDRGWKVQFISFQESFDRAVITQLQKNGDNTLSWNPMNETIEEFCQFLSGFNTIITMRAHGIFIAAILGVTPIPVRIEPKLEVTASKCGCSDRVLDFQCNSKDIVHAVKLAEINPIFPVDWTDDLFALDAELKRLDKWLRS